MKKLLIAFAASVFVLSACMEKEKSDDVIQKAADGLKSIVAQVSDKTLSHEKNGYGQGTIVDEQNRPTGALDFNKKYSQYGAKAINEDDEKIILTFDQGYENGFTEKILDTLKEKGVRAIFFLTGDYAEKNPDLIKRMIEDGHILGSHTQSHYSMPELSADEIKDELDTIYDYVKKHYGYEMTLLRPPMGEFSEFSLDQTNKAGYTTIMWSYAYRDWVTDDQPDKKEAANKLINAAHKGAIYLLHSVSETNAAVLGEVIDGIREKGFEFDKL